MFSSESLVISTYLDLALMRHFNLMLTCCTQSQSQRGDNQQQRPNSSYGAPGSGQPVAGSVGAGGAADATAPNAYQGQESAVNNMLSPHGLDPSQQQPDPYGAVYQPATTNNGVANDPY